MPVRIEIARERCTGHGRCYALAPELFDADDDGYGTVVEPVVGDSRSEDALAAEGTCPEQAITVAETER